MRFDFYGVLMNPFFLSFVTLFLGVWFGGWKRMGRMKFGVGGTLFVGIFLGWWVRRVAASLPPEHASYAAAQKFLSAGAVSSQLSGFVLILFIVAIGLLASRDLKFVLKKYGVQFVILGLVITFTGAVLSGLSSKFIPDSGVYQASGVYTGALTSSPGLGMAIESTEKRFAAGNEPGLDVTEALAAVGTGYAVSYPFGMIAVILAMLFIPRIFGIDTEEELRDYRRQLMADESGDGAETSVFFDLKSYAFVCTAGYLFGMIDVHLGPLGYVGLGYIGGCLLMAIICGAIGQIGPFRFRMDSKVLGSIRDITLASYIGMIGLTYGHQVVEALSGQGIHMAAASTIVAWISIMVGYLLGRYVFKLNWIVLSGAICGGMTSTPGLGMAVDSLGCDDPAAGYAATYPFALICMVLFTNIMYYLF